MTLGDIPADVKRFINSHINSVEQLEILLLLRENPQRSWTRSELVQELKASDTSVDHRLRDLKASQLIEEKDDAVRFAPADQKAGRLVTQLAEAYATRKTSVIGLIFAGPSESVRSFADAFRIREED